MITRKMTPSPTIHLRFLFFLRLLRVASVIVVSLIVFASKQASKFFLERSIKNAQPNIRTPPIAKAAIIYGVVGRWSHF